MLRDQASGPSVPASGFEREIDKSEAQTNNSIAGPSNDGSVVEVISALLIRLAEAVERLNKSIVDREAILSVSPPATNLIISIANSIGRIADKLDPPPPDVVASTYIATKLGCTTTWIAEMARTGGIPKSCIVAGTGNGKPWKFHRDLIENWIESR
jgi:hypothetical protein